MNYRSIADLSADIRQWIPTLPRDIDCVVAVPRSGLLAATHVALQLNLPLTTVDRFAQRATLEGGRRCPPRPTFDELEHVLVVDDSVCSGDTLTDARATIAAMDDSPAVSYGAVYATPAATDCVDTYARVLTTPRIFEWNVLHHPSLSNWLVDLDGVLCRDPLPEENDDGPKYREFIETVRPRVAPTQPIGAIVTCRLERYRDKTEQWLATHGIEYDRLVMMDYPSGKARRAAGKHAQYKTTVYSESSATLFIESNQTQARRIARRSRKPVFCVNANCLFRPGYPTRVYDQGRRTVRTLRSRPERYLREFVANPIGFSRKAFDHLFRV